MVKMMMLDPNFPGLNPYITQEKYRNWYHQSIHHPDAFWGEQASLLLNWFKPWQSVQRGVLGESEVHWFVDGKLNTAFNCLDRHLATHAGKTALIWEGDTPGQSKCLTYQQLFIQVSKLANVLKKWGVKKGDRVCIYLPMIVEAAVAMLACSRIGAIHSVVFAGFSAEALKARIVDSQCRVVITSNEGIRGNKHIELKKQVDAALLGSDQVHHVLVVARTDRQIDWFPPRDIWLEAEMQTAGDDCPAEVMDANDPLFLLYTSGSTGKPKGILHATGGYLVYVAATHRYIFDLQPGDIFWCTADLGWITGHSYALYGPLLNGGTTLLFEGVPHYPTPARYWEIIDKHQVSIFYTAPTAIRALRREGNGWLKQSSRKSLRILGSVGEPINPQAWQWYFEEVGEKRCPILDTRWQTETGGIMMSPFPGITPLKPGSASYPFFGVSPAILNDEGSKLPHNQMGNLVITQSWPGMMQTVYGDEDRFFNTYFKTFPGVYLTGDQARQDEDQAYWISGRSDDVIKVSGHRIGTEEVESALLHHLAVAETAVVTVMDEVTGHAIYAYVSLKTGFRASLELEKELRSAVRELIGPIATPKYIHWARDLPKTRSGKIMRRLLRKLANQETDALGDLSTLTDESLIQELIRR